MLDILSSKNIDVKQLGKVFTVDTIPLMNLEIISLFQEWSNLGQAGHINWKKLSSLFELCLLLTHNLIFF